MLCQEKNAVGYQDSYVQKYEKISYKKWRDLALIADLVTPKLWTSFNM